MNTWYVLQLTTGASRLLRCTEEGFERLPFAPGEAPGAAPDPVSPTATTDPSRARDAMARAPGARPHATRGPDQTLRDPGATEALLAEAARKVRQHVREEPGTVYVAMADARWALFQTVSGLDERPVRLPARDADVPDGELWTLTKARVADAA